LRILFIMDDFHGWTAGAMWEDTKFDLKHWKDIERLAIVGETKWEKGMANQVFRSQPTRRRAEVAGRVDSGFRWRARANPPRYQSRPVGDRSR
jgi:hypothetical protein